MTGKGRKRALRMACIVLITSTMTLWSGCQRWKTTVGTTPVEKPIQTTQPTEPQNFQFQQLTRNFVANVEGMGISVNGQLRIENDSIIWITVSKMVELARIKLTQDSAWVFLKLQNSYSQGSYTDLAKKMGLDIDYRSLQDLLVGNDLKTYDFQSPTDVMSVDSSWIFYFDARQSRHLPSIKEKITVNANGKITENDIVTANGYRLRINYRDFETVNNMPLAKQIGIFLSSKTQRLKATIVFSKTAVNQATTFPFSIPKSAKHINL